MDYIIADSVIMPGDHFGFFSEKICLLPHCYQPNDRKRKISERQYLRAELGLPQEAFVFCCFNNSWKITPEVFECWMTLLRRVPRSVLWLLEGQRVAEEQSDSGDAPQWDRCEPLDLCGPNALGRTSRTPSLRRSFRRYLALLRTYHRQ